MIRRFPFPGNVRQLENLCNWLTVMAPSQWIRPDDLPFEFKTGNGQASSEAASDVIATRAGGWTDQLAEVVRELLSRGTPKTMDELNRVFETTVYKTALEFTHGKKIEAAPEAWRGQKHAHAQASGARSEVGISETFRDDVDAAHHEG